MSTVYQKNSTTRSGLSKEDIVQSVQDLLMLFPGDLMLTMTIQPEKSGDCFVVTVTTVSLEDTETMGF